MANGQTVVIRGDAQRTLAKRLVDLAPVDAVVNIAEPKRTLEQSSKMFAMLSDIARAKPLGRRHTVDDWKALAMNACGWECQFQEGLDGRPFPIGFRSSKMTKAQMSSMIEWLYQFGNEHGVRWSEPHTTER